MDDCRADSCENDGTCQDDINGVICLCKEHYIGDRCQIGKHVNYIVSLLGSGAEHTPDPQ